jgi:hypothetical protein
MQIAHEPTEGTITMTDATVTSAKLVEILHWS